MRKTVHALAAVAALGVIASAGSAAADTVLNFDDMGVQGSYTPLPPIGFDYKGFRFSDNADVIDIGPHGWSQPTDSGDYAVLNNYWGSVVMTKTGGGVFNLAAFDVKGWYGTASSGTVTASLGGKVVGSLDYSWGGAWTKIVTNFGPADTVTFGVQGGNNILLDDVRIADRTSGVGGVPEPASWAMMVLGVFSLGAMLRQQRKTRLAAAL